MAFQTLHGSTVGRSPQIAQQRLQCPDLSRLIGFPPSWELEFRCVAQHGLHGRYSAIAKPALSEQVEIAFSFLFQISMVCELDSDSALVESGIPGMPRSAVQRHQLINLTGSRDHVVS